MYGEFENFFPTPGVLLSQPNLAVAIVSILPKMPTKKKIIPQLGPRKFPENLRRIKDYRHTEREADRQTTSQLNYNRILCDQLHVWIIVQLCYFSCRMEVYLSM